VYGIRGLRGDGLHAGKIAKSGCGVDVHARTARQQVLRERPVLQRQMEGRPVGEFGLVIDVRAAIQEQFDHLAVSVFDGKL
jgi:hypothetical protein